MELSDKREDCFRTCTLEVYGVEWSGVEWSGGRARCGRTHMRSHISAGEKKRKHVRTYKLGETRQIRDERCDVIGTLEASCRSRIKLCFAILSYPMLSYPINPACMPVPVAYASLCCYTFSLERRETTKRSIKCFKPYSRSNKQAEAPAQTTLATAACKIRSASK